jgi:hypothetical protein
VMSLACGIADRISASSDGKSTCRKTPFPSAEAYGPNACFFKSNTGNQH